MKLPIAVAIAATLLVACQEPTCACPPAVYQIRFIGSVTRGGSPITDARVAAIFTSEDCRFGETDPINPNEDLVNAGGHYEFVALMSRPGPRCARLVARWPGDSAMRDSIRVVAPSRDAVVVDFDLP
jgi:hypothetical protein